MVNPYEVYVTYLALKRHFSSDNYDFFKYNGKIRCSIETFKKCKERFFFEKLSRKKSPQEIINFFVSNFIAVDNPGSLWIGDIVRSGESIYKEYQKNKESLSYIFEQDLRKITEQDHLYELVKNDQTKHPKILKLLLNKSIKFETFFILTKCLNLIEKYDNDLEDPIWNMISTKIKKYDQFFINDLDKYKRIIRKYI